MAEDQKKAYLELQRMAAQFGYDLKLVDANTGREIKVAEATANAQYNKDTKLQQEQHNYRTDEIKTENEEKRKN